MFKEEKGEFVQILDNGNYHWVLISNINCSKNEIDYYGSLVHVKIKDHVKMQICNIFKCSGKELTVNVKACQQQTNGIDCGVFDVTNMFILIFVKLRKFSFIYFVTADFPGHGIIPKTKIWIWRAVYRARNGIIANEKT